MTTPGAFEHALAAARDGDPSAWGQLYDLVAPRALAYLRRQRLRDAENVLGEVLLQVVRDIDSFTGDEADFRAWVLGIAHHRMIDATRHDARRPADPSTTEAIERAVAGYEDPALHAVDGGDLDAMLAGLTHDQRTVVALRVVGGLGLDEVAGILGRSFDAVASMQYRALNALRAQIGADAS